VLLPNIQDDALVRINGSHQVGLMWHSNYHPNVLWFHTHTYFVRSEVTVMVNTKNTVSWDVKFADSSEKCVGFSEMLVISIRVLMSHPRR